MSAPSHYDRDQFPIIRKACLLAVALFLILSACQPVTAARDVRIALYEIRPSIFTDEQGMPTGFFVDIIEDLAKQEGWNVIWVQGSLSQSWDRLAAGEIDLIPGVVATPERRALFDFNTVPALSSWSQVYARPGTGITTILDLDGKRVTILKGDFNGIAFKEYAGKFGLNITYVEADSLDDLFSGTAAGKADALVAFSLSAEQSGNTYGLETTSVMFNPSAMAFAVQKGKNQDLIAALDRYIAQGKADERSTYSNSVQKWFGMKGSTGTIPPWVWWGLGSVAFVAVLFLTMSFILRREVQKKTAALSLQNTELAREVANRKRAEEELRRKNDELENAYRDLAATEEELRENYLNLGKSEQELMQARRKLNLLNMLTIQDVQSRVFALSAYFHLATTAGSSGKEQDYLMQGAAILNHIERSLSYAKKYQDLGIKKPRWQNVNHTLLTAISHLDLSGVTRKVELGDLEIYADPLLEDVFFTLMDNVVTHGAGASEVNIAYRKNADQSLTIFVTDNGHGVPHMNKEKIFTWEYNTADSSGLFLAREILSITGITIRETGEPGGGARFEILVPEGAYRTAAVQEKDTS